MKLRIGKRNIKTAIAVFLSVLVSQILKLEYPFFAVLAAIFSMENSIASSYKAGVYRIIGTLVGAFVGVIFECYSYLTIIYINDRKKALKHAYINYLYWVTIEVHK